MADEAVLSFLAGLAAGASRGYAGSVARSREEEEREKERKQTASEAAQDRMQRVALVLRGEQEATKRQESTQAHEATMAETGTRRKESAEREKEFRASERRDELLRGYFEAIGMGGMTTTEGEAPYTTRTTDIDMSRLTPEQQMSALSIMGGGQPMEMRPEQREYLDPNIIAMMDRQQILVDRWRMEQDPKMKSALLVQIYELDKMINEGLGLPEYIQPTTGTEEDQARPSLKDLLLMEQAGYTGAGTTKGLISGASKVIDWYISLYSKLPHPRGIEEQRKAKKAEQ